MPPLSVFSQEMASAFAQTSVNKHLSLPALPLPCNSHGERRGNGTLILAGGQRRD